jgi:hypothetical protein
MSTDNKDPLQSTSDGYSYSYSQNGVIGVEGAFFNSSLPELQYAFVSEDKEPANTIERPKKVLHAYRDVGKNTITGCQTGCHMRDGEFEQDDGTDINNVMRKLHDLEIQFHNNDISSKRSACFWDTCPFDTQPFYIPKAFDTDCVKPYGCFCCLECALAYLEKEEIDASCKYERRQLLFHMYKELIVNKASVKPAPDPRYTLDKFYGNLNIQEWRKLLKSDRMLLIVDKPLTPELPELHTESSERFMANGGLGGTDVAQYGKFRIRKNVPKQSKGSIIAQKFGVTK